MLFRSARTAAQKATALEAADRAASADAEVLMAADVVEAVSAVVPIVAQSSTTRSLSGATAGVTMRWVFEVVDSDLVPRRFMAVNDLAVRDAIGAGAREIPGLRIFEKASLRIS